MGRRWGDDAQPHPREEGKRGGGEAPDPGRPRGDPSEGDAPTPDLGYERGPGESQGPFRALFEPGSELVPASNDRP